MAGGAIRVLHPVIDNENRRDKSQGETNEKVRVAEHKRGARLRHVTAGLAFGVNCFNILQKSIFEGVRFMVAAL